MAASRRRRLQPRAIIFFIILGLIMAGLVYFFIDQNKEYYNEGYVNGNTPGNLYGSGLFCEYNGTVYFANASDSNRLYSMNVNERDAKMIVPESVTYINADEHYVYYTRSNNKFSGAGVFGTLNATAYALCRLDKEKNTVKMLDTDFCTYATLAQNKLYYMHYINTEASCTYSIGIDGKDQKKEYNTYIDPRCMVGSYMYYAGVEADHYLHCLNVANGSDTVVFRQRVWNPIAADGRIFCLDLDDRYKVIAIDNGSGNKQTVTKYGASAFNVHGNYLYYQSMTADMNGLYMVNLQTGAETLLMEGQFKDINITSKYVYFFDFNTDICYHAPLGTDAVSPFHPKVEMTEVKK